MSFRAAVLFHSEKFIFLPNGSESLPFQINLGFPIKISDFIWQILSIYLTISWINQKNEKQKRILDTVLYLRSQGNSPK